MLHTPRFVSNTFSLFRTAKNRRPKKLLVEKNMIDKDKDKILSNINSKDLN